MVERIASPKSDPTETEMERIFEKISRYPNIGKVLDRIVINGIITQQERHIFEMLNQGEANKSIARNLNISEETVNVTKEKLLLIVPSLIFQDFNNGIHIENGNQINNLKKIMELAQKFSADSINELNPPNNLGLIEYLRKAMKPMKKLKKMVNKKSTSDDNLSNDRSYLPHVELSNDIEEIQLRHAQVASIDSEFPQSKVGEIDASLTFTEEAMNDLNRAAENAVSKAREHNDEIEHLLGQLRALGKEGSK